MALPRNSTDCCTPPFSHFRRREFDDGIDGRDRKSLALLPSVVRWLYPGALAIAINFQESFKILSIVTACRDGGKKHDFFDGPT
ncbi:hypothetical protein RP20_CCG020086 [Aedes albopictus]|nr:hypothetical protein RP20_CCG020086 [Aedes albopictus]